MHINCDIYDVFLFLPDIEVNRAKAGTALNAGRKYELATHTVKVRRTGTLSDVMAIWDLAGQWVLLYCESEYFENILRCHYLTHSFANDIMHSKVYITCT